METSSRAARIFFVDTQFQKLARRPGGIPREQAIETAQIAIAKCNSDFGDWLKHQIRALGGIVARGEAGNSGDEWVSQAGWLAAQIHEVAETLASESIASSAMTLCEIFEVMHARETGEAAQIRERIEALIAGCENAWQLANSDPTRLDRTDHAA